MRLGKKSLAALSLAGLVVVVAMLGLARPLDRVLVDLRFAASAKPVSGDIVFIDIDSHSLEWVGVWPWPRSVHAGIIDRLMAMGAREVALDIDFSSASTEPEDAELERSLAATGGFAVLAAFQQHDVAGKLVTTAPLPRFRAVASVASVNVIADNDGKVRRFGASIEADGARIASLAATLSHRTGTDAPQLIDLSIDPQSIVRVSVKDLMLGNVPADLVANRQVIVGAGAVELKDIFTLPRFGPVPGPVVQILAAETLKEGRTFTELAAGPALALALALIAWLALFPRAPVGRRLVATLTATSLGGEVLALAMQQAAGVVVETAPLQLAVLGLVVIELAVELYRRRESALAAARQRDAARIVLERVVADNFDGVLVFSDSLVVLSASQVAETILGNGLSLPGEFASDIVPGPILTALARVRENPALTLAAIEEVTLAGVPRFVDYHVKASRLPGAEQRYVICLTFQDVTAQQEQQRQLEYLAAHDATTGALSRRQFQHELGRMLSQVDGVTVVAVGLSRFDTLALALGHATADAALRQIAERLEAMGGAALARIDGDRFALAFASVLDERALARIALQLRAVITLPLQVGPHRGLLDAHVGATTSTLSGPDPALLVDHADIALSLAQQSTGAVSVYSPAVKRRLADKREMDIALRHALRTDGLSLLFQPQLDLRRGTLVGAEALVRWSRDGKTLSPGLFVPLAEETGLIVELGRWTLQEACRQAMLWPSHVRLAVNVSPVQFQLSDVEADVMAVLAATGLPPERLDIEVTESIFVGDASATETALWSIRKRGVGIAIDDFGTGYSSFNYLMRLPVDKLKVDQSFVRGIGTAGPEAVVEALVALSHRLGKTVIAEGIETLEQMRFLRALGCDIGQGYLFGRPQPPESVRLAAERAQRDAA